MKRVYLPRHAKSSWKGRGFADHDRPLAPLGLRAAKAIAGHLLEQGVEPELVLCSTARRARETFERIERVVGTPAVRFEPELYGASAGALASRLRDVDDAVGSVLLIGHNPAIQLLALDLARSTRELREVEAKFPDRRARHSGISGLQLARACTRHGEAHRVRAATRPRAIGSA